MRRMWPSSLAKDLALDVLKQGWIVIWIGLLLFEHLNPLVDFVLYFAIDILHPLYLLQDFRIIDD